MEEDQVVLEEAGEEQEQEQEPQTPQVDPEVEKRAQMMGWVPKETFRGDPARWKPAEEFVQRADELMPIMKGQLRKYEDTISSLQNEVMSTRKTMEQVIKMGEKVSEREYQKARADIIRAQAEAVAAGDAEKWQQLEAEKDKLEPPQKIEVRPPTTQQMDGNENPVFKQWHADGNDWYLSDPAMTRYANAFAAENQNPGIPYVQWLNMVKEEVKNAFPHKFENPNRAKAAAVDGGAQRGANPGRPKAKGYNDLPADARIQCDKFVTQGLLSKEQYIKDYFEEV